MIEPVSSTQATPSQPRRASEPTPQSAINAKRITSQPLCEPSTPFSETGPDVLHVPKTPTIASTIATRQVERTRPALRSRSMPARYASGLPRPSCAWDDPAVGDRLRPLWDFDDLDASRERFLAQLAQETTDAGRAEVLTQLARVEGLRDEFERCDELLDEAEALGGVTARSLLERGRRERSSGRDGAGLAEFRQALERALESGEDVLAADAAHMLALVDDAESWTARGIEIAGASDDPGVRYWLGPLSNNIGWTRFDAGDHEGALDAFELALASRE